MTVYYTYTVFFKVNDIAISGVKPALFLSPEMR